MNGNSGTEEQKKIVYDKEKYKKRGLIESIRETEREPAIGGPL
jgi:hypothetical protein